MAEEEVKLMGMWASPFSRRIEIALKLKGIQYEYIEENLSNKSDLLLKYNTVHKKIPVLVHNGRPVAESLIILEYIDETWQQNPILPKDPYNRARAHFWAKVIDEKILQTAGKTNMGKGKEQEQLFEEVYQDLKLLENELKGNDFFGGEKIGYVDIVTFVIVNWFQITRQEVLHKEFVTEVRFPVLYKWLQKLLEIDLIKECLPPRDKHVAYIKAFFEAL